METNDFESEDDLFEMLSEIADSEDILESPSQEIPENEYIENISEEQEEVLEEITDDNVIENINYEKK